MESNFKIIPKYLFDTKKWLKFYYYVHYAGSNLIKLHRPFIYLLLCVKTLSFYIYAQFILLFSAMNVNIKTFCTVNWSTEMTN